MIDHKEPIILLAPIVVMVTKHDRSQKTIRYLVRQSQYTVYCAMGPKSFSAVMARKTTSGAE